MNSQLMNNLLNRRRGLMQGAGDNPVFVDWIEMHGQEYIDSGIPWSSALKIDDCHQILVTQPDRGVAYHLDTTNVVNALHLGHICANLINPRVVEQTVLFGTWSNLWAGSWGDTRSPIRLIIDIPNLVADVYYGDDFSLRQTHAITNAYFSQFRNDRNVLIGASVDNLSGNIMRKGQVRFSYHFNMDVNGVPVRRYRPCYYHNEYGLWDNLSNTFHGNASGAGAITGGYDD